MPRRPHSRRRRRRTRDGGPAPPAWSAASAASSCRSTWLRSAIASARSRKPCPCSARPGTGRTRETEPNASTRSLVADLDGAVDCVDGRHLASRVEGGHAPDHELGVTAHHPKRNDDMARLECSGRCFREQRREQHVVLRADDRGAAAAEPTRDDRAGVATAGDERPAQGPPLHGRTVSAEPVRHARQNHPRLEQQESLDVQRALVVQEALRAAEDEFRHHDHGDRVRIGRDSP